VNADQPSFCLAAIMEGEEGEFDELGREILRTYQRQRSELKSKTAPPAAYTKLFDVLLERRRPIVVEAVDMELYAIDHVVSFVLHAVPLASGRDIDASERANTFADTLIEAGVNDLVLPPYRAFAKDPREETGRPFVDAMTTALAGAIERHRDRREVLTAMERALRETLEARRSEHAEVEAYWRSFLPPPDETQAANPQTMLPHTSSFSGVCWRLNKLAGGTPFVVRHDEQNEFGPILRATLQQLEAFPRGLAMQLNRSAHGRFQDFVFPPGRAALEFVRSEDTPGVQLADLVAGFVTRRLNAIIRRQELPEWSNEIARRVHNQQPVAIRVMSSTTRAQRFHTTARVWVAGATMG